MSELKQLKQFSPLKLSLKRFPSIQRPFSFQQRPHSSLQNPTIYALSSAPGKAAVSIIRVSGPLSKHVLSSFTSSVPVPRKAALRKLKHNGKVLDHALVLFFEGPKSFSGEDLVEFHLHGGSATVKSVLSAIQSLKNGIRHAEPGEFTQRAFQNGRLDLTEAEGIRDLIDAETETQRQSAINSMEGYNKQFFSEIRQNIVNTSAMMSALIDFGDDYEVENVDTLMNSCEATIVTIIDTLKAYLERSEKSQLLMDGIKMALVGPANAGKSSLLNRIANKDAAIVSSTAGTTRDVLDLVLDIGGYKIVLSDTAGVRESSDAIELEGIRRAKQRASTSDILCFLASAGSTDEQFIKFADSIDRSNKHVKVIVNKIDLLNAGMYSSIKEKYSKLLQVPIEDVHMVSCKTGLGISETVNSLESSFRNVTQFDSKDPISLSHRARALISEILQDLDDFKEAKLLGDIVLASEALNRASHGIGKITGEAVGVEEILGIVFSTFCIGK